MLQSIQALREQSKCKVLITNIEKKAFLARNKDSNDKDTTDLLIQEYRKVDLQVSRLFTNTG